MAGRLAILGGGDHDAGDDKAGERKACREAFHAQSLAGHTDGAVALQSRCHQEGIYWQPASMPAQSDRPATLPQLLAAIIADEAGAVRLVRATPALAGARVATGRLVNEIPHQLYAGDTALHLAAAALRPRLVRALVEGGADANAENRRGAIALHYACDARPRTGRTWTPSTQRSVIELLLDAGSDIEHTDKAGATPLHRAVRARSPEAVRCLLKRGARVDAKHGRQRTTPLHIVMHSTGASGTKGTRAEQQAIVELLLRYGADPGAKDAKGNVPKL